MTDAHIKLLADLRSGAVRLVPNVPTLEMVKAGAKGSQNSAISSFREGWAYALAASPDLSASLAEMIEGLVGERDAAARALRTVQNAAKTIASAHGTELEHLRQNASFDHALRAEVESLREHGSEMTDALLASDSRVSELQAENEKLRAALEPFAQAADIKLCGGDDHWTDDKRIQGTDVGFHITFGDLRRARALSKDHPNGQG